MNMQRKLILILVCVFITALAAHCGRKGPDAPPDVAAPTIISTHPTGSNVPADTDITITFNEPVNENSVVFTLVDQNNTIAVARSVSGSKVVFTPTAPLADNTFYTALLNSGVKDLAGNVMLTERSWYFRTAPTTTAPGTAYTVTATAGTNGSITPSGSVKVNQGETHAFTVTANAGFHISSVTGCGGSLSGTTYTTGPVTADCTVTASFASNAAGTHTITVNSGSNGSVSPAGPVTVSDGATATFTISPNTGYHISSVTGCSGSLSGSTYTTGKITTDCTITASFAANAVVTHTITVSSGSNGSVSPAGPVTVSDGATATFTISPNTGYHISSVTGCSGSLSGSTYTTGKITTDCMITASFAANAPATHTITASVVGGHGKISPSGSVTVTDGKDQSFKMEPDRGYSISAVIVDGVSTGHDSTYTFHSVTTDHTISVSFTQASHTITGSSGPNGTISPSGTVTVIDSGSVAFTMTPDAGFSVADVLVDGITAGPLTSYMFTNVIQDHSIYAAFSGIMHRITATAGPNGSISPSGAVTVAHGASQSFQMAPDTGFVTADVLVDDRSVGPTGTFTFTAVTADHSINAVFAGITPQ